MKGFKGFDNNLKCRGFQFEQGKEYEEKGADCCNYGFHFCEYPLDVFGYYPPSNSRYSEVEGSGEIDKNDDGDSKVAVSNIKIGLEIGLPGIIKAGVEYIKSKVDWENAKESNTGYQSAATNTGDYSAATNTGNRSAATNTGDYSAATNTGNRSAATVEGQESIAVSLGIEGKARGKQGCWLVLAEWKYDGWNRKLIEVKSVKVDGKTIKEEVFYSLINGEVVEVK